MVREKYEKTVNVSLPIPSNVATDSKLLSILRRFALGDKIGFACTSARVKRIADSIDLSAVNAYSTKTGHLLR
jgi:hypothetical protein